MDCEDKAMTNQNVGGIVGASCSQPKTYENCQFDGIISGTAKRKGGVLGRALDTVTAKNCVVSGLVLNADGNGASILGRKKSDKLVAENCYSSIEMLDALNGTPVTQITKSTDLSALLALKDAAGNAVWTREDGAQYPILAIAKTYLSDANRHLSVAMSGTDYSVVKFTAKTTVADKTALDTVLTVMKTVRDDAKRELFTKNLGDHAGYHHRDPGAVQRRGSASDQDCPGTGAGRAGRSAQHCVRADRNRGKQQPRKAAD